MRRAMIVDLIRRLGTQADDSVADAFDGGCSDVVSKKIALQQGNMIDITMRIFAECYGGQRFPQVVQDAYVEIGDLRDQLWQIGEKGDTYYMDE